MTSLKLPSPRIIDPQNVTSLRWGVMGPGGIAHVWVEGVLAHTGQRIEAVGSTSAERAREFAQSYGISRSYGSYDDLLADNEIDAIYVSTRQQAHRDNVLSAIAAGKHVLVEKPIATRPDHVLEIERAAHAAGVLVMEAMWTTYLPQSDIIRQLVANGEFGDIRYVQADFGQDLRDIARLHDIDGGGAAHDLGIYPMAFVSSVLPDAPTTIEAAGELAPSGVDIEIAMRLSYANGGRAYTSTSIRAFTETTAWIDGTNISVRVGSPFFIPSSIRLMNRDFNPTVQDEWIDTTGVVAHAGLSYQATAFASFLDQGLTESPWRSLAASARDAATLQTARQQFGVFLLGESRE
jgi:predicted dehydrogenase